MDHKNDVVSKRKNTIETGILLILSILLLTSAANAADTGWVAPGANTGGSGVSNPSNAYIDNTAYVSFTNNGYWNWYGYALSSIPSGSIIDGIEVNAKGRESSGCSSCYMRLRLSYDGGMTWTSYINTASSSWTTTISNHIAGGQTNKWGREWTRDEIVNNLRVQANWIGSTSGRLTYLPVRIYYTEAVDITPPVITLPGLSSVTVEAGSVYTDAGATAHDNIDGDLTSSIITGGLPVNTNILGPHTVTYDVTDSNGNAAIQVTRTVTVVDTTPPVITLSGSNPVTVEVGSLYIDSGATASDNIDGDITSSIVTDNPVNTALIGTYTVTYNVEDSSNNNADQKTRTVNVVDITGPEITLNGNNPETVEVGSTYTDAGAIVTDNYDTGLSATVTGTVNTAVVGVYILTYNAVDSSGNAAIAKTRTVNVVDTNTPIITLSGSNPVTVEAGSVYTDAGATALDNIDGDITSSIVTGGLPVNTSELGAHTVTYDVTDNNSNAAIQVTRTVNVVDTTPPAITLSGSSPVTIEAGSVYTDAGATALDNYDSDLTSSIVTGGLPVDTNVLGAHTVTYDVNDTSNNSAIQLIRTVTVVDTTPPVITLSGSNPVIVEAGFFVYTDAGATALDNYDGDLTSSIVTGGLPINTNIIGPHTVTYDVTDSNGNAAIRVTRTVIVSHTLPTVRYISGTVIDSAPAHTPLAGVTVSTTGGISSVTDGYGKYSLVVGQGSYPLSSSYDIRYYTNSSVTVSTTGFTSVTQDIELELKPTGTISGTVIVSV